MGGPPLEFIKIQPKKGGPALEFINIQPPKGGPPLEFINIQPQINQKWGSASKDNFYGSSGTLFYNKNAYLVLLLQLWVTKKLIKRHRPLINALKA